jgi:hypothetical protein
MEIWDEHRWEEYLQESDRRTELFHRVWEAYMRDHPPPPDDAPEHEREAWDRRFHNHLAEQMGLEFPDDDEAPEWLADEEEPLDESETWKAALPESYPDDPGVADLPEFATAVAFREALMEWGRTVPEDRRGSALVELYSGAIQAATRLRAAHLMGYEMETLGGNIAKTKRALEASNRALAALRVFRDEPFMQAADYRRLYEQGFEVRNAIGLRVQQLRERFEQGLD